MRKVETKVPSFPSAPMNIPLDIVFNTRWQVICGDQGHYRIGIYSPEKTSLEEIDELEWHSCPEFFILLSGKVILVLSDEKGGVREIDMELFKPVFVSSPHSAYCPNGPHTGVTLVVERDEFTTEYREVIEWTLER